LREQLNNAITQLQVRVRVAVRVRVIALFSCRSAR
jgi:hypothetical protein